jgi:Flp pilus assembly secretin CpaC
LDYISRNGSTTLFSGNNVNQNRSRTSGATRFPTDTGLISPGATATLAGVSGTGALINLTSQHINYITEVLAQEFNADIVTAPEVVTLNGQNVEFVAGGKIPFQIGQNVIQGTNNNIQQFFYKHVGTFISVTPKIVNWGFHGEGRGEGAISASEIWNWNELIKKMLKLIRPDTFVSSTDRRRLACVAEIYKDSGLVPIELQTALLIELNRFSRRELQSLELPLVSPCGACGDGDGQNPCDWRPENCTVDLSIVARFSEAGTETVNLAGNDVSVTASIEQNVRAVANVIQVKSGEGVVMAGLIGEREIEDIAKVPVLGDIPVAGYLFRSTLKNRQKTELLIFLEARVLDTRPAAARAQSYEDFRFGQPYVQGHFLDNPLEYGMYRAGFGTYLPPHSFEEKVFWERMGRRVKKVATEVDDAFK